jgi:hypothetical protein
VNAGRGLYAQTGIQTFLVVETERTQYHFLLRRLEPLEPGSFDRPGSHCGLYLDEIEKILD